MHFSSQKLELLPSHSALKEKSPQIVLNASEHLLHIELFALCVTNSSAAYCRTRSLSFTRLPLLGSSEKATRKTARVTEAESSGELTVWLSSPSSFREERPESAQGLHILFTYLHRVNIFYDRFKVDGVGYSEKSALVLCTCTLKNLHCIALACAHSFPNQQKYKRESCFLPDSRIQKRSRSAAAPC